MSLPKKNANEVSNLHHFILFEGGRAETQEEVSNILEKDLNFQKKANSNYYQFDFETLLIDEAREIIELQNRKNISNQPSVVCVFCNSINTAAQNALLKAVEEPKSDHYIFISIPQTNILLPTFISRAIIIKAGKNLGAPDEKNENEMPSLADLKKMPVAERIKLIEKWTKQYKNKKITKQELGSFINQIMNEMHEKSLTGDKETLKALGDIHAVSRYFDNNGAHIKSILEFLMLNI